MAFAAAAEDFTNAIAGYLQRFVDAQLPPGGVVVGIVDEHGSSVIRCGDLDTRSAQMVAEIAGVRQYVQVLGRGVVGVATDTGRFLLGYNRAINDVANVPNPQPATLSAAERPAGLIRFKRATLNAGGFDTPWRQMRDL